MTLCHYMDQDTHQPCEKPAECHQTGSCIPLCREHAQEIIAAGGEAWEGTLPKGACGVKQGEKR